ncbi:uncharacterized protein METZ01_LOCUS264639, partial [marine metagenome]
MKSYRTFLLLFLCSTFAACGSDNNPGEPVSLDGDEELASYGFGQEIGNSLFPMKDYVELDKLFRGIQ